MTATNLLPPRLPLFRYLRRDPQANFLCLFALLILGVGIVLFFVVDRSNPEKERASLVTTAIFGLIALVPSTIALVRWRRQAHLGRIGVRTPARVSNVFISKSKDQGSYVLLDYVFEGQPQRWKYVTVSAPGLALGDELDLFVDPKRPQRVVPVSLFVMDGEDAQR